MSFYSSVVLTSIIRTSLAETTLNAGINGAAITVDNVETMVNNIKTTVAGKGLSHRQAIMKFDKSIKMVNFELANKI